MSCELTSGFIVNCRDSTGGIKEFYVAKKVTELVVTTDSSGIATSLAGAGLEFFRYQPRRETGVWNDDPQANEQNGSVSYQQTCMIPLTRMEQRKRNEVKLLAQANLIVIVKDQNDKYFLMGEQNGMTLANSTASSGTAYLDRNGYELNFEGAEPEPAREVDFSAFSSLINFSAGDS